MLKFELRPQDSKFWRLASPLLALVITVVLGIGLFVLLGKDPVRGLQMFFWEPLKSAYALGELMDLSDNDLLDLHLARKPLDIVNPQLDKPEVREVLSMLRETL